MSIVEMRVDIDCAGCQTKIKKALSKLNGVDNIDIDMDLQKVTVTGSVDQMKVLKTVRKTGKNAELWPFPYNPEYHNFTYYYGNCYAVPANNFYSDQTQGYNSSSSYFTTQGYNSPSSYFTDEQCSTYNYHKHGYNGHEHGYYQQPPSAVILDDRTSDMFSDDNATGCSVM